MPTNNTTMYRRVLIVDDHPIVRQGLIYLLTQETDLAVCGEAEDTQQAIHAVETLQPDIALVDIALKRSDGLDLIKHLKRYHSDLPVLVLSMHDEALYAERVLRAGARGYVMKQEAAETIIRAIRRVLRGELYVSDKMMSKMMGKLATGMVPSEASPLERLSDRELEVLQLIGQGQGTRQIAERLHLSVKTVESHRARIKEKLQFQTTPELVQYAIRWVHNTMPT